MRLKYNIFYYPFILAIFAGCFFLFYSEAPGEFFWQSGVGYKSDEILSEPSINSQTQMVDCSGGGMFNPFSGSIKSGECKLLQEIDPSADGENGNFNNVDESFARGYLPTAEKAQILLENFNRGDILSAASIIIYQERCLLWIQPGNVDAVYPCELLAANYHRAQRHLDVMVDNNHPDALLGLAMTKASPLLMADNADSLQIQALMNRAIQAGSGKAAAMRENSQSSLRWIRQ